MKKFIQFVCFCALTTLQIQGQVKIGDNPNTINPNSLLELESTNKGLLSPRVTLTSLASAAPLTAPVPAGMLVYNTGGSLANGFYYWNGSAWVQVNSSQNSRNNFVLVKSASDFPAPVGGIITLAAGVTYEINGSITLTNRINLNNAWLRGLDAVNDQLIYTPASGELFTGANGGNIKALTLSAPNNGARIFNLNAAGANRNLIMENLYIVNSHTVGNITGFGGTVFMQTVAYFTNINGITFTNDTNVVILNTLWDKGNSNTYETFTGTFSAILKSGGAMQVQAANTATAINVSGITSVMSGEIKNVLFMGNGTYKTGNFSNRWEVESTGLNTEKDDVAMGNIYVSTAAPTTFTAINTPTKVLGTTTAANLFRVTAPVNNRLTYTGRKTRRFQVICSLSMLATANNKNFSFYISRNGVLLPESRQLFRLGSNTDRGTVTLSCTVELATNQFIEVWAENNTDNTQITVESMNLAIR